MNTSTSPALEVIARQIRGHILTAVHAAQSGHPGPSLSMVEIMTTLLFQEMETKSETRDYFILSKGHAVPCFYAAHVAAGHLSVEALTTLRQLGSPLQGHPVRGTLPYVDASTGSLGQGLSVGIGYALGIRLHHQAGRRVYVALGDGELQEGQIWEAAMAAAKFKLGHLLAIVDYNKFQNEAAVETQMPLEPLAKKWESFGWHVQVLDGHNIHALLEAYQTSRQEEHRPSVIIAHTIKGKGVSFMENTMDWHSKAPSDEEYARAMKELTVAVS